MTAAQDFFGYEPFVDEFVIGRFLQLEPRQVLEMVRDGEIPGHPLGRGKHRRWRFRISEVASAVSRRVLHAATALRPEESFGLRWEDLDWKRNVIHIRRGWSKGKETAGKNEVSMTNVAMHPALAAALQAWRRETRYAKDSDWVFSLIAQKVRSLVCACSASKDYLRPAAVKAGVISKDYKGRLGWHNLRHSLASFFADNDVNLPVIKLRCDTRNRRQQRSTSTATMQYR